MCITLQKHLQDFWGNSPYLNDQAKKLLIFYKKMTKFFGLECQGSELVAI